MLIGYMILRWGPRHPRLFFWRPLPRGDAHRLNAAQCLTTIFKDPLPSHPLPGSFLLLFPSAEEGNFPHGSAIKNLPANAGDTGDVASIPVSGIPRGRNGSPLQCSCLENSMARGACWATVPEIAKSWETTSRLSTEERKLNVFWPSQKVVTISH